MGWWVFVGVVGWVLWDCYLSTSSSPSLLSTSILPLVFRVVGMWDRVVGVVCGISCVVCGITCVVCGITWCVVWFRKCGCVVVVVHVWVSGEVTPMLCSLRVTIS